MKTHHVLIPALLLAVLPSANATTFTEYAHNVKNAAVDTGKKVVQVGAESGHAVVHAAKVVGRDVADGVKDGYHATTNAVKKVGS